MHQKKLQDEFGKAGSFPAIRRQGSYIILGPQIISEDHICGFIPTHTHDLLHGCFHQTFNASQTLPSDAGQKLEEYVKVPGWVQPLHACVQYRFEKSNPFVMSQVDSLVF